LFLVHYKVYNATIIKVDEKLAYAAPYVYDQFDTLDMSHSILLLKSIKIFAYKIK